MLSLSKISLGCEYFVLLVRHHACFLVFAHPAFEEVGLSLQRNHIHPFKRILRLVMLSDTQGGQQTIRNKLDVLRH